MDGIPTWGSSETFRDVTDCVVPLEIRLTDEQASAIKDRVKRKYPELGRVDLAWKLVHAVQQAKSRLLAKKIAANKNHSHLETNS